MLPTENDADTSNNSTDENMDEIIKCIFLSEFHATVGTKIVVQQPNNYITKELFDIVNRYIIPKVQLQRSFLSVSLVGTKILGFPVRIDSKKYIRNAFYFNLALVFNPSTRTVGYEPIIKKLTEHLLSLELSSNFLSQAPNPEQISRLEKMLGQVRSEINSKKMCILQDGDHILPLCVVPHYQEIGLIQAYKAPVLLDSFYEYVFEQWDLTTLRIVPCINGFNHIDRIAGMADVSVGLVQECVRHLVLLGVALVVPVFQYSNVYRPTPKLALLAKSEAIQKRAVEKCSRPGIKKATVRDIFRMFASMAHGCSLAELFIRFNPAANNINERQTVLFGLIEGLIRPIYRYPVAVSKNMFVGYESLENVGITNASSSNGIPLPVSFKKKNAENKVDDSLSMYFTGVKSFDEISLKTGLSNQQLEEHLSSDQHVIVLLK